MVVTWGQAKIQVLALKPEITAALEAGRSVGAIYDDLSTSQRISMSRITFYRWCRRLRAPVIPYASSPSFPSVQTLPAAPAVADDPQHTLPPDTTLPPPGIGLSDAERLEGKMPEERNADELM